MAETEPIPPTSPLLPQIPYNQERCLHQKLHLLQIPNARSYEKPKSKIWRKRRIKKMQQNLLKQQFETFTIGSRKTRFSCKDKEVYEERQEDPLDRILAIRNKVVDQEKTKSSQSAIDRNKVIIEDWVDSDDEETDVSESQKETAFNSENINIFRKQVTKQSKQEPSNTPKLKNLMEHRFQGKPDQFGTTSKDLNSMLFPQETLDSRTMLSIDMEALKYDRRQGQVVPDFKDFKGIRVTRKVQDCLHVNFLENQENQKGKGPDWMFDLDLLTPSMNYIPLIQHPRNLTAAKEVSLSSEEQALHDELVSLMHQESLAKSHNDDQRIAFEEEKRRISIAKGKEHVDSTFTLRRSTDYNNMDPTIDVHSTPTTIIHEDSSSSPNYWQKTAGVQTRIKIQDLPELKQSDSFGHLHLSLALLSIRWMSKCNIEWQHHRRVYFNTAVHVDEEPAHPEQGPTGVCQGTLWPASSPKSMAFQDKYVKDIHTNFDYQNHQASTTPLKSHNYLGKEEEVEDVDVTSLQFQVTPKVSHLHAVKRIFRYLKHQPNLGLWYPKDSPFHLEAFSDSDYAGDNHDRRSTSGGCQYLGRRLVSWQCKKQTIVAISSTEAEYVAAASCCAQVLWMQNQLLDYGFNFMNTEIHIDNESTICIVKNPVFHSKTKHIQIRHHFIRDCYEQRLINVVKVHTDDNVADLLTKGFDLARFNFLVVTIGMMNP
ncbi:hypothetical protein Tco_1329774 [Tanacetum coccineum]